MSCCGKEKAERLKEYRHARTLCKQAAGVSGKKHSIYIKNSQWGEYYDIIEYEKAQEQGKKIIASYIPGSKAKTIPKGVAEYLE